MSTPALAGSAAAETTEDKEAAVDGVAQQQRNQAADHWVKRLKPLEDLEQCEESILGTASIGAKAFAGLW